MTAFVPVIRFRCTPPAHPQAGFICSLNALDNMGKERQRRINAVFLVHLLRVAGRRLMVIWDGSPVHRRALVKQIVSETNGMVRLEVLPGYAPDLNPLDEGGWHHLKHVEMRNLVCRDAEELHQEFHLALGRLRQKPQLIQSFFAKAGLRLHTT